jgi:hypothetical protein
VAIGQQVMVASCCPCVRYESARGKTKGESICRASEAGFSREQNEPNRALIVSLSKPAPRTMRNGNAAETPARKVSVYGL